MNVANKLAFRSDTITKPCAEMRKIMAEAVSGDDVYGEDSAISDLEAYVASQLGKEKALFVLIRAQKIVFPQILFAIVLTLEARILNNLKDWNNGESSVYNVPMWSR